MRYPCLALWIFSIIFLTTTSAAEHIGIYNHGTIVRMHMGDCLPNTGILGTLSGNSRPQATEVCPEYTLMSDRVVYVIVGRPSKDVLPLAQEVDFRIRKNEIAVRVDDGTRETRFLVREMILRAEWDRMPQQSGPARRHYSMPVLEDQ
ncbi:MAG TPA: hypothetical protein VMT53_02925 [Terriglobales bacterium]|nr:hypothetical protein [Terriglobales bacterium]